MRRLPLVLAGLLVATLVAAGATAVTALVRREPARPDAQPPAYTPVGSRALRVLHAWDERRAQAWSHGSVRELGALYARHSSAGAADEAMLAAYRERGLRVTAMRRQTLAVRRVDAGPGRLTLEVTDRLAYAVAVGDGVRQRLPRDAFASRTLTLRRSPRGWVLVD